MPATYFKHFNRFNYANTPAIDLTERVVVQRGSQFNPFQYYPLNISDGIRADMIAHNIWGDPYASWILYLTNNIIDPYYDFYLTREQFIQFINEKYGTVTKAQQLILYYQTDWSAAEPININAYEALDAGQKKYYEPNYANTSFVQNYTQKKHQLTVSTNYVLSLTISGNAVPFIDTEMLHISYLPGSNGTAQFIAGTGAEIYVQHGVGDAFPYPDNPNTSVVIGGSSYVYGVESGANAAITDYSIVSMNIPLDEEIFWSPVYAYDYEETKNAGNRIVNILQPKYVPAFINNTANLLSKVVK
jgi:hypothetical protein